MDGEAATIQVQQVIPIQTINRFSEGAIVQDIVTYQDEEVGISLRVTPHINNDSAITMEVNPIVQEIIGFTGPIENQRPITSERSVNTTVTVNDNQTIVLGGLLKESQIEVVEKVPLLGHIPILGALFTNRNTEVQTTDLLILITPRIVN
jgi:type II secretory pathway component GspD/PulD (secretin)